MAAPCVLLTSCSENYNISDLVKQILSVIELPASTPVIESIVSYPWAVNTKYYTADVLLCTTDSRTIGDEQFAENVEAFIAYVDVSQSICLKQIEMWLPYLRQIAPSVQLLVCDRFDETSPIPRMTMVEWCLKYEFEVVELNPAPNQSDDDDDDDDSDLEDCFKETIGVQRIIEALSCHSWSNAVLKDKPSFRSPYLQQLMTEATELNKSNTEKEAGIGLESAKDKPELLSAVASEPSATQESSKDENTNSSNDAARSTAKGKDNNSSAKIIDSLLGDAQLGEEGEDNFEKLFEKLQVMKESAGTMSFEERKKFAEQVTVQFWEAIGGNMDEIDGLSDEETDSAKT